MIVLTSSCRLDSLRLLRCRPLPPCSRRTHLSALAQANRLFLAPQHPASPDPSLASRGHRHSARTPTLSPASSLQKGQTTLKSSGSRLPAVHPNQKPRPSVPLLLVLQARHRNLGLPPPLAKEREASTTDPSLLPLWALRPPPSGHLLLQDLPDEPSPPDHKPLGLTALQLAESADSSLPAARSKLRAKVTLPPLKRRRRKARAILIVGVTRRMRL
jgi:hypothetical protein